MYFAARNRGVIDSKSRGGRHNDENDEHQKSKRTNTRNDDSISKTSRIPRQRSAATTASTISERRCKNQITNDASHGQQKNKTPQQVILRTQQPSTSTEFSSSQHNNRVQSLEQSINNKIVVNGQTYVKVSVSNELENNGNPNYIILTICILL